MDTAAWAHQVPHLSLPPFIFHGVPQQLNSAIYKVRIGTFLPSFFFSGQEGQSLKKGANVDSARFIFLALLHRNENGKGGKKNSKEMEERKHGRKAKSKCLMNLPIKTKEKKGTNTEYGKA